MAGVSGSFHRGNVLDRFGTDGGNLHSQSLGELKTS